MDLIETSKNIKKNYVRTYKENTLSDRIISAVFMLPIAEKFS